MEYLVIDVGGSAIKYALMNDELEMLKKGSLPTPQTNLEDFKQAIASLYQKYENQVDGIAMSLPGLINKKTQKMQIPGALYYNQNVEILKELQSITTPRLTIENDAKCAALCEVTYGNLQDTQVGAVCIIGTGIGGAFTIGKEVFTGAHGFSGEWSYLSFDWSKREGFEKKWGGEYGAFKLVDMICLSQGLEEGALDGIQAFELCNQGNKKALQALEEFCDMTAMGLYNLQAVVDPDKIAIGGGISQQPILMEYLQKSIDKLYASLPPIPQVNITRCKYHNDSNLIGALAKYKQVFHIHS